MDLKVHMSGIVQGYWIHNSHDAVWNMECLITRSNLPINNSSERMWVQFPLKVQYSPA